MLSANQIVRCFKLKKLKNYMRYKNYMSIWVFEYMSIWVYEYTHIVKNYMSIFGFHWNYKKYHAILGYAAKYSWPINLQDFFTSGLFDLLILIPGVHCYIVLVSWHFVFCLFVFFTSLEFFVVVSNQVSWVTAYWILSSNKVKLDIKVFSKVPFRKWWYRVEICVVCFKLVFVSDVTIL